MRIMIATDGSPSALRAVHGVAQRTWPAGTEVEVVTVVHARVPYIPEPTLIGAAVYADVLERDRQEGAPARVREAEQILAGVPGLSVRTAILEGDPGKAIVEEAERSKADLLLVGSHGYGPVKRMLLGSVSRYVAEHAPCTVEIVRLRQAA